MIFWGEECNNVIKIKTLQIKKSKMAADMQIWRKFGIPMGITELYEIVEQIVGHIIGQIVGHIV